MYLFRLQKILLAIILLIFGPSLSAKAQGQYDYSGTEQGNYSDSNQYTDNSNPNQYYDGNQSQYNGNNQYPGQSGQYAQDQNNDPTYYGGTQQNQSLESKANNFFNEQDQQQQVNQAQVNQNNQQENENPGGGKMSKLMQAGKTLAGIAAPLATGYFLTKAANRQARLSGNPYGGYATPYGYNMVPGANMMNPYGGYGYPYGGYGYGMNPMGGYGTGGLLNNFFGGY